MTCKRCQEFVRKHPLTVGGDGAPVHTLELGVTMDPVECAFESGVFSPDNWNCETMNALRRRALGHGAHGCTADSWVGVVPIPVPCAAAGALGHVVLAWYKSRGRTGRALVLFDDDEPLPLTLALAEAILDGEAQGDGQEN